MGYILLNSIGYNVNNALSVNIMSTKITWQEKNWQERKELGQDCVPEMHDVY